MDATVGIDIMDYRIISMTLSNLQGHALNQRTFYKTKTKTKTFVSRLSPRSRLRKFPKTKSFWSRPRQRPSHSVT